MLTALLGSLRFRLIALVLLTSIPAVVLVVHDFVEHRNAELKTIREDLSEEADRVASTYRGITSEASRFLARLANKGSSPGMDETACARVLGDLAPLTSGYTQIGIANTNGDIVCSAPPLPGKMNISDQDLFLQVALNRVTALGSPLIKDNAAGIWGMASPVEDPNGALGGVAFLAFNAQDALKDYKPYPHHTLKTQLLVLDDAGTVRAAYPNPEPWLTQSLANRSELRALLSEHDDEFFRGTLPGDKEHLFGMVHVTDVSTLAHFHTLAGVPTSVVYGHVTLNFLIRLSIMLGGYGILLVLVSFYAHHSLFKPLQALGRMARRIKAGQWDARIGPSYPSGEIGEFARTMDEMSAAVQDNVEVRIRAAEEIENRNRSLSVLYAIDQASVEGTGWMDTVKGGLAAVLRTLRMDAGSISIMEPDGKTLRTVAWEGLPEEFVSVVQRAPANAGLSKIAIAQMSPVMVDASSYPWPTLAPLVQAQNFQKLVGAPMVSNGVLMGMLFMATRAQREITRDELALVNSVASQLAAIIHKEDLQERIRAELESGRKRVDAIQQITGRLGLEQDHVSLLRHIVDEARVLVDARYGALATWDTTGRMNTFVPSGISLEGIDRTTPGPQGAGILAAIKNGTGLAQHVPDGDEHPPAILSLGDVSAPGLLTLPIYIDGDQKATLYLTDKVTGTAFSQDDQRLMHLYALIVGMTLRNADLVDLLTTERNAIRSVLLNMAEGLAVLNAEGRVVWWNRSLESLTGIPAEQALGKPAREILAAIAPVIEDPAALQSVLEAVEGWIAAAAAAAAAAPPPFDVVILRPRRRDVTCRLSFIGESPSERLLVLLVRDATEERDLARRKDAFISIASHEIRTPMTTVLGFTELLLQRDIPEDTRRQWLRLVHEDSARLMAIVDDLLNVKRIEAGKISIAPERVRLAEVLEGVLARTRPATSIHEFVVDISADTPPVWADRDKLTQVITNLVSNAAKYSPKGGRITVSTRHEPEQRRVVMCVSDQGIGIAPEDIKDLFNSFHRIRRPETEGIRGTGLGLYIVKALVELMRGEVWVQSELGKGSTFCLSIPTEEERP